MRQMSPRRPDPFIRPTLVDVAARLLIEKGPQALSARHIAAAAGSSTMAMYTHFGGMNGLIREIVHEGFGRLQRILTAVGESDDPVADLALVGRAYRHNAVANLHLYAIMFGGSSSAGFSLTEDDRRHGRYTLATVVERVARCMRAGRFRADDPELVAHQMWIAIHGLVTLELGDYLIDPCTAERCFEAQLIGLMVGAGDTRDAATRSVALSRTRLDEVGPQAVRAAVDALPAASRSRGSPRTESGG